MQHLEGRIVLRNYMDSSSKTMFYQLATLAFFSLAFSIML